MIIFVIIFYIVVRFKGLEILVIKPFQVKVTQDNAIEHLLQKQESLLLLLRGEICLVLSAVSYLPGVKCRGEICWCQEPLSAKICLFQEQFIMPCQVQFLLLVLFLIQE